MFMSDVAHANSLSIELKWRIETMLVFLKQMTKIKSIGK